MLNIDTVDQAIDFIESRLHEDITVADIAASVAYSLYHFCRTFSQIARHTPYDYLMRRRLAEAAHDLLKTDQKIIEIAAEYCFNNTETFGRAFKRVFGILPTQWRKNDRLDPHQLMPRLTRAHLAHMVRNASLKPTIEDRAASRLAGMAALVRDDPDLPDRLREWFVTELELWDANHARDVYSLRLYPNRWADHGYFYFIGIEIGANETIPATWVIKTSPLGTYARFTHQGADQELPLAFDYLYHTWLPQSGWALAHPWNLIQHRPGAPDSTAQCTIAIPIERHGAIHGTTAT